MYAITIIIGKDTKFWDRLWSLNFSNRFDNQKKLRFDKYLFINNMKINQDEKKASEKSSLNNCLSSLLFFINKWYSRKTAKHSNKYNDKNYKKCLKMN